ncbi:MAG: DUF2341 domain-containing protein, partial [Chitinivibrionales bacterium]|nr:DUF2341 domain-containing protein [Chitinivibrionales bacterium]MBD3357541.1 DUF2341 domain-containing protein [Chitinivibrionales bacterium]
MHQMLKDTRPYYAAFSTTKSPFVNAVKLSVHTRILLSVLFVTFFYFSGESAENYSNWQYHSTVEINTTPTGADLAENVTNFPMLIRLEPGAFNGFANTQPRGTDIRFAKPDGSHLPYEIERWVDGTNDADTAEIWVKLDTVYGNALDTIFMYYGNSSVADSSQPARVFETDFGFAGVWHLGDTADATSNDNAANPKGSGEPAEADAVVGLGKVFDGADDYLKVDSGSAALNVGDTFTVSFWAKYNKDSIDNYYRILTRKTPWNAPHGWSIELDRGQSTRLKVIGSSHRSAKIDSASITWPDGKWVHIAIVFRGSKVYGYSKGKSLNADGFTIAAVVDNDFPLVMGAHHGGTMNFPGNLDEVRLEGIARESSWIKLCYESQKNGASVISFSTPSCTEPQVENQPQSTTVASGQDVSFSVEASGSMPLSYQWQRKESGSWQTYEEGSRSYTFTTKSSHNGMQIRVIVSNSCGEDTSNTVVLTVDSEEPTNPIILTGERVNDSQVRLSIRSFCGVPSTGPFDAYADTLGIWYAKEGYVDTPDPSAANLVRFGLEALQSQANCPEAESVDTVLNVGPLASGGDSSYYFTASLFWRNTASGDSIVPINVGNGVEVLMFDTARVPIALTIDSAWYTPADNKLHVDIANTGAIDAKAESLAVWYGFGGEPAAFDDIARTSWIPLSALIAADPYAFTVSDQRFVGDTQTVRIALALRGDNGRLSEAVVGQVTVGVPLPTNNLTLSTSSVSSAYEINLQWTPAADSVRVWYGFSRVPDVPPADSVWVSLDTNAATQSLLITGLDPQTTYHFGVQVHENGLWSHITEAARVSAKTLQASGGPTVPNLLRLDTLYLDSITNRLMVRAILDATAEVGLDTLRLGVDYDHAGYPTSYDGNQAFGLTTADTLFALDLAEGLLFDTTYYVTLWLRGSGGGWAAPTPDSRALLSTPSFTWQSVTFFEEGAQEATAIGGKVIFRKKEHHVLTTNTIRAYTPSTLPPGFVRVGLGLSFDDHSPLAPFLLGMGYSASTPDSIPESAIRIYRDSGGVFLADHQGYVDPETNTAWTTADDLRFPFVLLADMRPPTATIAEGTDLSAPIGADGPVPYDFSIADNIGNVSWTFRYGKGNGGYVVRNEGELDSVDQTVHVKASENQISDSYGLRAQFLVSDGVWHDTLDVSRSVRTDTTEALFTPAKSWVPLRAPGILDEPRFDAACSGLSEEDGWSYDINRFRAFRWVSDAADASGVGRWQEYADSLNATTFAMTPGKVVWVKTRNGRTVTLGKGRTTSLREPYRLELAPKAWTDFSAVYKFPVRLCDILWETDKAHGHDTLGGFTDTLQFARWMREENVYKATTLYAAHIPSYADALQTARIEYQRLSDAYSVYNPFDTTVYLHIPGVPPELSGCGGGDLAKRSTRGGAGWDVGVVSTVAKGAWLSTIRCGVSEAVTGEVSFPRRPSFSRCGVGVVHGDEGVLQAHAIVPTPHESGGVAFELVYYNDNDTPERINSKLVDTSVVPMGHGVRVFAPEKGAYLEAREDFAVTVPAGGTVSRWLMIGESDYLDKMAAAFPRTRAGLLGSFPNPFHTRARVRYSLSYQGTRELTFAVYDMRGRRVWHRRFTKDLKPGMHSFVWDATDSRGRPIASGRYHLRMTAISHSGEPRVFGTTLTCV